MERETSQFRWRARGIGEATFQGRWQSFADVSCESLSPLPTSPDADRWSFSDLAAPRGTIAGVTSTRAARLRTTAPLVDTWGAGMRFDFTSLVESVEPSLEPPDDLPCPTAERDLAEWPAEPIDLGRYRGVTFFAKADPEAGATTISVLLLDQSSDPRGGICDPALASPEECFNSFAYAIEIGPDFRRYSVDFSELEQDPQWGYQPVPNEPDLEHVYGIAFQVFTPGGVCPEGAVCPGDPPSLTFDVWVDDVYLVGR
jgi:hypothetical protein